MWRADDKKLVKVRLQNQGHDVETPWAEDLGPAPGDPQKRWVQLSNIPVLYSKPTYQDVLEVESVDGYYEWDAKGVPFEEIGTRIAVDHGRWVMILDYSLPPGMNADLGSLFRQMDRITELSNIALEGARVARDRRGGRAYFAVPSLVKSPDAVMRLLANSGLPFDLTLVHPVHED